MCKQFSSTKALFWRGQETDFFCEALTGLKFLIVPLSLPRAPHLHAQMLQVVFEVADDNPLMSREIIFVGYDQSSKRTPL